MLSAGGGSNTELNDEHLVTLSVEKVEPSSSACAISSAKILCTYLFTVLFFFSFGVEVGTWSAGGCEMKKRICTQGKKSLQDVCRMFAGFSRVFSGCSDGSCGPGGI